MPTVTEASLALARDLLRQQFQQGWWTPREYVEQLNANYLQLFRLREAAAQPQEQERG